MQWGIFWHNSNKQDSNFFSKLFFSNKCSSKKKQEKIIIKMNRIVVVFFVLETICDCFVSKLRNFKKCMHDQIYKIVVRLVQIVFNLWSIKTDSKDSLDNCVKSYIHINVHVISNFVFNVCLFEWAFYNDW